MQKKKLDLNNLLAKYQGISSNTGYNSRFQEAVKENPIDQEFYQYKTYQQNYQQKFTNKQVEPTKSKGNFSMSKSQVEAFLLSLKDDLKVQERGVSNHAESALRTIHQNFQKNHEKIKKQIIDLLQRAFLQNERAIKQELARRGKNDSVQFAEVYKKIQSIDHDIQRLLNSVRGPQYRKAIAEVVTRDFNNEIIEIRSISANAKQVYIQSLGEIQPDRSRIEAIKEHMLKLFSINRKSQPLNQINPVNQVNQVNQYNNNNQGGFFSMFKDKSEVQAVPAQSKTRRSFFNFGNE